MINGNLLFHTLSAHAPRWCKRRRGNDSCDGRVAWIILEDLLGHSAVLTWPSNIKTEDLLNICACAASWLLMRHWDWSKTLWVGLITSEIGSYLSETALQPHREGNSEQKMHEANRGRSPEGGAWQVQCDVTGFIYKHMNKVRGELRLCCCCVHFIIKIKWTFQKVKQGFRG